MLKGLLGHLNCAEGVPKFSFFDLLNGIGFIMSRIRTELLVLSCIQSRGMKCHPNRRILTRFLKDERILIRFS